MEVSSHALHQERVRDIQFDVGIFTNLSRDHLDYHGSMEAYFTCKKYLFEILASGDSIVKAMVSNADTPEGRLLLEEYGPQMLGEAIGFGQGHSARLRGSDFQGQPGVSSFRLSFGGESHSVSVPFLGVHNMENLMAVVGAGLAFGWPLRELVARLPNLPQVPGRLEQIAGRGITSYVDYAHSPDALLRVLTTLRESTSGRLIAVFGCGGDRDKGKRPLMRMAAEAHADLLVVTSDNPRSEDPESIIADIMEGSTRPALRIVDRRTAIARAVEEARPGDVILVAGKGHEDYQIIGDQKIHFSDQELLRDQLA
jgi:UDP-N-acetylmuramoyl-L-alanyl-D-glutamate--2,6-diaminopimelate ligase